MSTAVLFERSHTKRLPARVRALLLSCSCALVACGLFDFPEPQERASGAQGGTGTSGESATSGGTGTSGETATSGGTATSAGGALAATGSGGNPREGGSWVSSGGNGGNGGEGCDGSLIFPRSGSAPLDDFLGAGGALSSDWILPLDSGASLSRYFVVDNGELSLAGLGELNDAVWHDPFGASQEAWTQINFSYSKEGNDTILWLKDELVGIVYWQWEVPAIEIWYRSRDKYPVFYSNKNLPALPTTLGGRVFANGCVEVFVDGQYLGGGYLGELGPNGDPKIPPLNPSEYSRSGRIGIGSYAPIKIENFGGGTIPDP